MAERYITRRRLPGPQRNLDCPVILAAGALLEDTQKPRLVAQLKFRNLSVKTVSQLYVSVQCGDGEPTIFRYHQLAVGQGQTFGQYTALELPPSDARELYAEVRRVEFADGSHWNLAAAQRREAELEQARQEEAARREAERQKAVQEAEARAAARKAAAEEKAAKRQEAKAVKAKTEPQAEQTPQPAAETIPVETAPVPAKKSGKKVWLALGGMAVVALVAGLLLLPKLIGGGDTPEGGAISISVPGDGPGGDDSAIALPGDNPVAGDDGQVLTGADDTNASVGDSAGSDETLPDSGQNVVPVYLQEDENGECIVDPDTVKEAFPESDTCNFFGIPAISGEIDPYLMDSFPFAWLVREGTDVGFGYDYSMVTPRNEPKSTFCLLVFQDDGGPCLIGYFVGTLADEGNGRWRMDVTPCHYEFSQLVDEQRDAFYADREFLYENYIPPEEVAGSGAAYYIRGYNTGRDPDPRKDDCQMYHLWSEFTSPYLERFARSIDRIENVTPSEGRWVCCLLLDKNYELLGYTMLTR